MGADQLPDIPHSQIQQLQAKIMDLRSELQGITDRTSAFESILASKIEDHIIEEQELTLLYKQQKKAKKDQRNEQKRRGKNYRPPKNTLPVAIKTLPKKNIGDQQEKKRLYREAMLFVHPDKFSMQTDKLDLATEITTKLIEIYRSGDLETLQAYHAHIFNGNTLLAPFAEPERTNGSGTDYLILEWNKLKKELEIAKDRHTYKVLTTYKDPMLFLEELKAYYQDRILKLKRRTRTV